MPDFAAYAASVPPPVIGGHQREPTVPVNGDGLGDQRFAAVVHRERRAACVRHDLDLCLGRPLLFDAAERIGRETITYLRNIYKYDLA